MSIFLKRGEGGEGRKENGRKKNCRIRDGIIYIFSSTLSSISIMIIYILGIFSEPKKG